MANIIFRLPSKQIQYGYVEVSGTPEEFGIHSVAEATAIGLMYAHYVGAYLEGEVEGVRQYAETNMVPAVVPTKKAPGKPVEGVSGVRQVRTVSEVMSDEDVDTEAEARALLQKELGATVIEETKAPWDKPTETSKPKPWENNAAPKVAKIDW